MSAYSFEFQTISGEALPLSRFEGRVVLIVNTASRCGFTPQYRELQGLWERYRARGLAEILSFCEINYDVDFPLTAKQAVTGEAAHPFYKWIAEVAGEAARPRWNFHKYLIGPQGQLVDVYPGKTSPLDPALVRAIEALLGA